MSALLLNLYLEDKIQEFKEIDGQMVLRTRTQLKPPSSLREMNSHERKIAETEEGQDEQEKGNISKST